MENKKLKNEIKNFDMGSIDLYTFSESLLICVPKIKKICHHLDDQIHDMAITSFIPYVTAIEQCNDVIDNMILKSELMNLYRLCANWYHGLTDNQKEIFKAYFVKHKRKSDIYVMSHRSVVRIIDDLVSSFLDYIRKMLDHKEKELIKNPFIYKIYITRLKSKENYKNRGRWNKGENKHDNTTDEGCYSSCV